MGDLSRTDPGIDQSVTPGGKVFATMGRPLSHPTPGVAAPQLCFGSGAPTIAANKGSLYIRTDGTSTTTRLYSNTDGGTTWTPVTSVA